MVNPYYSLVTFGFNVKLLTKIQFAARYAAYKHKFRVAEVFYPPDESFIELPLQKKKNGYLKCTFLHDRLILKFLSINPIANVIKQPHHFC